MISVFGIVAISFAWVVLVAAAFRIYDKGQAGLSAFFWCLLVMFVPVIIFAFANIVCRVYDVNETAYYIVMAAMCGVFVGLPIMYHVGRFLFLFIFYPPKKIAKYARKTVGRFRYFHRGKWPDTRYYSDVHANEQAYIGAQITVMQRKLGNAYKFRLRASKKRFVRAIMEESGKELPQLQTWEFHTALKGLYRAEKDIVLSFDDGEQSVVYLGWPKLKFTVDELIPREQRKYTYAKKCSNITMTGRLIYILMCIERYLVSVYPDRDWTPVARRMWNRPKSMGRWTEGSPGDLYREIVPERIMRFYKHGYGYEKLNPMVFDKKLSLEDYKELRKLYEGISRGDPKEEINRIVGLPEKLIYQVNLKDYDFAFCDQMTIESMIEAEMILESRGIELPDFSQIEKYTFERTSRIMDKSERKIYFGFGVDATELSILLDETAKEKQMQETTNPIRVNNIKIARGHIILWLEKSGAGTGSSIEEKCNPGFVYLPGELTMDSKFYVDLPQEWNWIKKPEGATYFLDDMENLGTVTDEEKKFIMAAVDERNKSGSEKLQIIFD